MPVANTDPARVKFEMDCGWVATAGYRLLYIKAFKTAPPHLNLVGPKEQRPMEIGHGLSDYKTVFAAGGPNEN